MKMSALTVDHLRKFISELNGILLSLQGNSAVNTVVWEKETGQHRHTRKNAPLFVFLKTIRYFSILNAFLTLFEKGHVNEMGILCRCMDEALDDAYFLAKGLEKNGALSERQQHMLDEFYQEEFEDLGEAILKSRPRARVPRKKVSAAIARDDLSSVNPHDAQTIHETVNSVYSGYVHGAYPHTMELYGGLPATYHLSGMLGTPRMETWSRHLATYTYRGALCAEITAKKLGDKTVQERLLEIRLAMEKLHPDFATDLDKKIQQLKRKQQKDSINDNF